MKPELFFKHTENECITTTDGRSFYISRSLAVSTVLILRVKKIDYLLLIRRSNSAPDFKGYWANVTGYLDYDETLADAVRREIYEEAGLDVNDLISKGTTLYGSFDIPHYTESNVFDGRQNVSVRYVIHLELDELPIIYYNEKECLDGQFFPLKENYQLIANEEFKLAFNHKDIIMEVYKTLYSKQNGNEFLSSINVNQIVKFDYYPKIKSKTYKYYEERKERLLFFFTKKLKAGIYNDIFIGYKLLSENYGPLTIEDINSSDNEEDYILENGIVFCKSKLEITLADGSVEYFSFDTNEECLKNYNVLYNNLTTI